MAATSSPAFNTQVLHGFFDASPIGIAVESLEGRFLFVNPALCAMLGVAKREMRGKYNAQFSPPEDVEKDQVLFQQLRAGAIDHCQIEKRFFRRDGSLIWGRVSFSLLNTHPSTLVLAIVEDITPEMLEDRKAAQALDLVTKQIAAAIAHCSRDFRYRWVNRAYADWLRRPLNEVVGRPIVDVLGKDAFEALQPYFKRVLTGENVHYEQEMNFLGIGRRWVSARCTPTLDVTGAADGWVAVVVDITEQRMAEKTLYELNRALAEQTALLQSREELLKIFVKNVPAGVAMLDRDMRYLQVSDRWCADYSVDSSRILGRSHYDIFPDLPQRWKEIHRLALTGQTLRAGEDRWDRENGTTWVRWEIRPWTTPDGAVGGILIFSEDITKRKEMEEALLVSSRKLIESQEQERARIGRELHDDINQRLAMLAMSLEQLQDNPSGFRRRVQDLRKDTIELSIDVQGLAHELHAAKLEYLGIVAGIKSWCKQFSKRQRIEVDFKSDVPNSLPYEIGLCLLRVLQEGLHNAVKYSGVKRIAVQLAQHPREIHLMISDSGTGFDVEVAKQGKGLGLTSMRERVLLVNGTITIESRPMAGTAIHVRIPVAWQGDDQKAVG